MLALQLYQQRVRLILKFLVLPTLILLLKIEFKMIGHSGLVQVYSQIKKVLGEGLKTDLLC